MNRVGFILNRMSFSEKLFYNFSRLFHCSIIKVRCFSTRVFTASANTILPKKYCIVNTFFATFFKKFQNKSVTQYLGVLCPLNRKKLSFTLAQTQRQPCKNRIVFNGEGGIWTLAPRERPTPLAGAPLQPLEYFSMPDS